MNFKNGLLVFLDATAATLEVPKTEAFGSVELSGVVAVMILHH
jgi:hypothetical protein